LKTGEYLGFFGYIIGKKLQGHKAIELYVLGFVNNTHAASPELLENAVVGDGLADERVGTWHVEHMLGWGWEASQRTDPVRKAD